MYRRFFTTLALLGILSAAANADTIVSVNFDINNTSTQPVPGGELNGVVSVSNWNNADLGANGSAAISNNPYGSLMDSTGAPIPTLSFSFAAGVAQSWNTNGSGGGKIYGDFVINLDNGTFDITGIPDNNGVRLITYHNAFNDDVTRNTVDVTANGVTKTYDDHLWDNGDHGANPFLYTEGENYLDFDMAATNSISISFNENPTIFTESGFNAFQLVISDPAPSNVPEPASIAIWSLLGLCLAGYGYRQRRNK